MTDVRAVQRSRPQCRLPAGLAIAILLLAACGGPARQSDAVQISSAAESATAAYLLTGVAMDNVAVTSASYRLNDGDPQPLSVVNGAFSTAVALPAAETTISVSATDAAGNTGTASQTVTVVPGAGAFVVITSPDSSLTENYVLAGVAADTSGISELSYRLRGGPAQTLTQVAGIFTAALNLTPGSNTVVVTAVNGLGEEASASMPGALHA